MNARAATYPVQRLYCIQQQSKIVTQEKTEHAQNTAAKKKMKKIEYKFELTYML